MDNQTSSTNTAEAQTKPTQATLEEEIACLAREVAMREGAYPKFVASGRMKQHEAEYQLNTMRSSLNRLKALRYLLSNFQ